MSTVTPIEWFRSLNNFLTEFYDSQCKIVKVAAVARKKADINAKNNGVRKVPSSIHKSSHNRRSSLTLSTPLKDKSPNSSTISVLSTNEPFTPKPSELSAETPFTEGRSRRVAATKADKYIDIVSRRLAEVPTNGSTPKSMKIASKLISEASPNSRRNILLSQTFNSKPSTLSKQIQNTPVSEKSYLATVAVPAETPASVRKRNRTAKIHKMFQTPLMSLASAANAESYDKNSVGTFSPSNVNIAPSTISRSSKLNQVHVAMSEEPIFRNISPVKEIKYFFPAKAVSPVKSIARAASKKSSPSKEPHKRSSPTRRSPRISPVKIDQPVLIEPLVIFKPQMPSVAATPKAPVVEFVAPQSVLRSSKRPRKQAIFNDEKSLNSSPALKKQAKMTDPSIFPTVSINSQSQVKITPQTSTAAPAAIPVPQPSVSQSSRASNVPAIIVPLSAAKSDEFSSTDDLHDLSTSTRKTPLRVQPAKTPTRAKAVIPSLSDYSAATKIAVIEVAKNTNTTNNSNNNGINIVGSTPKVEPWTTKFMQKDAPVKTAFNINVKPVDTSKISGFSSAAVPIVPKFPLNLANISNITKTSIITEAAENKTTAAAPQETASATTQSNTFIPHPTSSHPTLIAPPPESPLTRAKRIDSENSNRDEKLKTIMETKADKLKKAMGDLKSSEKRIEGITNSTASNSTVYNAASSKLPVKPKAISTVLPSPKIPSRLAEAFSGIDSELPPIDIGLIDDEKFLKNILNGASTKEANFSTTTTAPTGFINPKMKKAPPVSVNNENKYANNNVNPSAIPNNSATQLHRTAVLNSATRKINESKPVTKAPNLPSTPKPLPLPSKMANDNSSPFLPEIPSDDELEKREKMTGKENRPTWAMTPNLTVALNAQRSQRAEDVFGKVQPIKLEDFFKGSGKKFPNRSSTSNWNNNI